MEIILVIFLGLACGMLVNYLSDVLPNQRKLVQPACPACNAPFNIRDYLSLRPCAGCGRKRSLRTYIVLALGALSALGIWLWPPAMGFWFGLVILTYFGMVTVIDLEHRLILHITSLAGAVICLVIGSLQKGIWPTLLGGLVGFGFFFILYLFGLLFARYRARKMGYDDDEEALGFGDVTLSGVIGLILGWPTVILGLTTGILLAGGVSLLLVIFLVVTKRYQTMNVYTAYGPYLIAGALVFLFAPQLLWWMAR
jgi:leader peptidase (prepilin peptidase) / N-methyltransferase